jgi:GTP cyclohydrolase I
VSLINWTDHAVEVDTRASAVAAVATLLDHLGYHLHAPGLRDTPDRVVRALEELTEGERYDPADHLGVTFPAEGVDNDELILVTGVEFTAMCEHHLLPFTGQAAVGYVPEPGAPVVGLSKLARLVDGYAKRATMQERITRQVTDALNDRLTIKGAACVLRSQHACMGVRGVRKPDASMVTSSLTGAFRHDPRLRDEFLSLVGNQ